MEGQKMQRSLENRHIQMIALGGAIGTGLFYGSATTIQLVGPGILFSYLLGGIAIFFIMRALGEMAVEEPVAGSFSQYAYRYCSGFAGFFAGWNYWMNYAVVSMAELSVVGTYIQFWLPDVPGWMTALACLVLITLINLSHVKAFGEMEFWFSLVKVLAIISMIVFGGYLLLVGIDGVRIGSVSYLYDHGGFLPNGWEGFLFSLVIVMFSFGGTELIGITAGEAARPEKSIPEAIHKVMGRILVFYVGALAVILMLTPWTEIGSNGSPFVQIFSQIGIPAAAALLNVVVLTAALSTYNSALYSNGRMLYALACQGNAPRFLQQINRRGVPQNGVLVSSGLTLLVVVLTYLVPGKVFLYLISLATIAGIMNWAMILVAQLRFRQAKEQQGAVIRFKLPLHPLSSYLTLAFLAMVVIIMGFMPDMRYSLYLAPCWVGGLYAVYRAKQRRRELRQAA